MAQMGWKAANNGEPTFIRGVSRTHIDVTLTPERERHKITEWKITNDNPFTYHGQIYYKIGNSKVEKKRDPIKQVFSKTKFEVESTNIIGSGEDELYQRIVRAYKRSTGREVTTGTRNPYWWNTYVSRMRDEYLTERRRYSRRGAHESPDSPTRGGHEGNLRHMRRNLKKEIRRTKKEFWRGMLDELEEDIWGEAYKIITRSTAEPCRLTSFRTKQIVRELFPYIGEETNNQEDDAIQMSTDEIPIFTREELMGSVKKYEKRKSPGCRWSNSICFEDGTRKDTRGNVGCTQWTV